MIHPKPAATWRAIVSGENENAPMPADAISATTRAIPRIVYVPEYDERFNISRLVNGIWHVADGIALECHK